MTTGIFNCAAIREYAERVRAAPVLVGREQIALIEWLEILDGKETIQVDEEQLARYFDLQQYFPFRLLPWEKFCFALHCCTYRPNGRPRFPILFILVGRGAGKNGYLSFENFALLTPVNGIPAYNIDDFATSEEQAKTSFEEVRTQVLEANEAKMHRKFDWTKESITNKATGSTWKYHTRAPGTKDGGRPGKVNFDEFHAYENTKLIDVAVTGLGKVPHPRRTIVTTQGDVRDGPLDTTLKKALAILAGEKEDGGMLPFICRLDSDDEAKEPKNWHKANPSLQYFGDLMDEIMLEYAEWLDDPVGHPGFMTKRMNRPQGDKDAEVTSWEHVKATARDVPDLTGKPCVWGIDYASTSDFMAAGLLFLVDGTYYWITHTWVCKHSKDLHRIQYPLAEAEQRGHLTFVDEPDMEPSLVVDWLQEQRKKYKFIYGAIDHYRFTLMGKYLKAAGFIPQKGKEDGNYKLTYLPEQSAIAPSLKKAFNADAIIWGENSLMRWYVGNTKQVVDKKGNVTFEKIEPKSRKTDGFMAFVAAFIVSDRLEPYQQQRPKNLGVYTYG